MNNTGLIDKLKAETRLTKSEWEQLISSFTNADRKYAADLAQGVAVSRFGKRIYFRGIVEFSNYCKCDCLYCGIRRGNHDAARYRLERDEVLSCCESGYEAGFRTFVLQSGEDPWYSDERMAEIVSAIRQGYPDCAITLSIGERSFESYKLLFDAGANRYLLRHESANPEHYAKLHPSGQSFENRMRCLDNLKAIGYQTGCGMMIGSPYQTPSDLALDMLFMRDFKPEMIGTGPFIPHGKTPFAAFPAGSVDLTLLLLSLCRIMLPDVLLPATTALGTVSGDGRQRGVLSGANVIMPNLSPVIDRKKYMLYDNKAITGDDAAESLNVLGRHMREIGYELTVARGDFTKKDD